MCLKKDVQQLVTKSEKPTKYIKKKKTNNSQFTKTFIEKKQRVYSASKFSEKVDYGYVKHNLKKIKYFENCLTWNINGSIGKVHYRQGKFSLSGNFIPLIVKDDLKDNLDLIYFKYAIEMEFRKHYFNFDNKAGKEKIIEISISIDKNGNIDIYKQTELAEKFMK